MSLLSPVTGEVSDSKVAAVFDNESYARTVASEVQHLAGFQPSQVQVVTPGTAHPGRKLEPEGRGIFRTILVSHFRLGVAGLIAGALLFGALHVAGIPAIVNSPWAAAAAISGFGGVLGLFAGGLVSLRPDHTAYINAVQGALDQGRCAVVVHAFDTDQRDRAEQALVAHGGETVHTL